MADIVLKDRNGNDVTYEGIKTVTFDTPTEGVQATFTEGVAVDGLEIVPDFSGGDMPVTAPDGTLVKSATIKKPGTLTPENVRNGVDVGGVSGTFIGDTEAVEATLSMADGNQVISPTAAGKVLSGVTIKKPETLIPENIAEGVDIAGIIGTLAGGGANVIYASGTFANPTVGDYSISHNLGVTPDIVIIYTTEFTSVSTADVLRFFLGFSAAFSQAIDTTLIGFNLRNRYATTTGGYKVYRESVSAIHGGSFGAVYIDSEKPGYTGIVYGANNESFILNNASGASGYVDTALTYNWLAIGGLT